jgi:RNA polymerase primary sigma factor
VKHYTKFGLCSREEERDLAIRIQSGDMDARNELVERNVGLVKCMVRYLSLRHPSFPVHRDDLFQSGIFGLMRAADKFSPDAGTRFSTYASKWIRQAVFRELWKAESIIDVPIWHAFPPKNQQPRLRTSALLEAGTKAKAVSCDYALSDCHDSTEQPWEVVEHDELCEAVLLAMDALSPAERDIVTSRIATDSPPVALRALGREYGVTGGWIRQIEQRGLAKLRKLLSAWK